MKKFLSFFATLLMVGNIMAEGTNDCQLYLFATISEWYANDNYKFVKTEGQDVWTLKFSSDPAWIRQFNIYNSSENVYLACSEEQYPFSLDEEFKLDYVGNDSYHFLYLPDEADGGEYTLTLKSYGSDGWTLQVTCDPYDLYLADAEYATEGLKNELKFQKEQNAWKLTLDIDDSNYTFYDTFRIIDENNGELYNFGSWGYTFDYYIEISMCNNSDNDFTMPEPCVYGKYTFTLTSNIQGDWKLVVACEPNDLYLYYGKSGDDTFNYNAQFTKTENQNEWNLTLEPEDDYLGLFIIADLAQNIYHLGGNGDPVVPSEGYTLDDDFHSHDLQFSNGNYGGTYTFKVTKSDDDGRWNLLMTCENTQYHLSVTDAGWATMYLPFATNAAEGVTLYTGVLNEDKTKLMLTEQESVPAQTPVLIKAEQGQYNFFKAQNVEGTIETSMYGVLTSTPYSDISEESLKTVLTLGVDENQTVGFHQPSNGEGSLPANKCCLLYDGTNEASIRIVLDEETGLKMTVEEAAALKKLVNGIVLFDHNGQQYDAYGRIVK